MAHPPWLDRKPFPIEMQSVAHPASLDMKSAPVELQSVAQASLIPQKAPMKRFGMGEYYIPGIRNQIPVGVYGAEFQPHNLFGMGALTADESAKAIAMLDALEGLKNRVSAWAAYGINTSQAETTLTNAIDKYKYLVTSGSWSDVKTQYAAIMQYGENFIAQVEKKKSYGDMPYEQVEDTGLYDNAKPSLFDQLFANKNMLIAVGLGIAAAVMIARNK